MLYAFKLGRKLRGEEPYCPEKGGKGGSSDKSAKYAAEAQKYAADLQNQQWQTIMKNLAPFPRRENGADYSRKYTTGWHKRNKSNATGSEKSVGAEIC